MFGMRSSVRAEPVTWTYDAEVFDFATVAAGSYVSVFERARSLKTATLWSKCPLR